MIVCLETIAEGGECRRRYVTCWRRLFQTQAVATGKAWSP